MKFRTAVLLFSIIALTAGCATTRHVSNFNYYTRNTGGKGSYLLMNDGKKITGSHVQWSDMPNTSTWVSIDNQRYRRTEVKAVCQGGIYFIYYKGQYLKRIITGNKLNVYSNIARFSIGGAQNYETPGRTYIVCWLQRGSDGELVRYTGNELLATEVRDCPMAYGMAHKSSAEIRRLTKDDPDYLNRIVDIFNNNCRLPEEQAVR
ncbi:MAG: hypothetical protein EOO09_03740 [Chitinophagaceae bacterium]|nr:MAG: hypothetical protein EOO09_03740 [Chitinophagaceae bacterium]